MKFHSHENKKVKKIVNKIEENIRETGKLLRSVDARYFKSV